MPKQEIFMDELIGARRVQVVKTYDPMFAREVLDAMDERARRFLSLRLELEDIPTPDSPEFADTIWQEVEEGAREDWNAFSYFVVTESSTHRTAPVFVCSDWPQAQDAPSLRRHGRPA